MNEHHCNNPACPIDGVSATNAATSAFYADHDRTRDAQPAHDDLTPAERHAVLHTGCVHSIGLCNVDADQ